MEFRENTQDCESNKIVGKHKSKKELFCSVDSLDTNTQAREKVDSIYGSHNVSFKKSLMSKSFLNLMYKIRFIVLSITFVTSFVLSYLYIEDHKPLVPPSYFKVSESLAQNLSSFNGFVANKLCFASLMLPYEAGLLEQGKSVADVYVEKPIYVIKNDEVRDFYCVLVNGESMNTKFESEVTNLKYMCFIFSAIINVLIYYLFFIYFKDEKK